MCTSINDLNIVREHLKNIDWINKLEDNVNENIDFYFGETFRDAFTRGCEHLSDYHSKSDDSHMYKHLTDVHPGCKPSEIQFGMSVVKKHKSSFER